MTTPRTGLPSVSVVVPTRGRPRQLAHCVAAIGALDYPRERFELIVVDDGSPELVEPVLTPFRGQLDLRVVRTDHVGPAAARNQGARHANGAVLAFIDDDCLPEPRWLRMLAAQIDGSDVLVGGRTLNEAPENLCGTASQAIVDWVYAFYNGGPDGPRFFTSNNFAVPRAAFLELGGFDPSFITSEDRELCDRWRHHGLPLAYAEEARVVHASELTPFEFTRRHFGYGRGAYRYNAIRRRRQSGSLGEDFSFYRRLPAEIFTLVRGAGLRRGAALGALFMLWQVANAAGFAWEAGRHILTRTGEYHRFVASLE